MIPRKGSAVEDDDALFALDAKLGEFLQNGEGAVVA